MKIRLILKDAKQITEDEWQSFYTTITAEVDDKHRSKLENAVIVGGDFINRYETDLNNNNKPIPR